MNSPKVASFLGHLLHSNPSLQLNPYDILFFRNAIITKPMSIFINALHIINLKVKMITKFFSLAISQAEVD